MGLDITLLAVPKEVEAILKKAEGKVDSEYSDVIFHLPRAFQENLQDFGHPDWIEFKVDAQNLAKQYPKGRFHTKFYIDTYKTYGVLDYLITKAKSIDFHHSNSFFYDGIEFENCKSSVGFSLMYWDLKILEKKKKVLDEVSFKDLLAYYDFKKMTDTGVYKIEQLHNKIEALRNVFMKLKFFLREASKLKGYVLILKG